MTNKKKGSATAPTVPSHGSRSLTKETKMNSNVNSSNALQMPAPSRRGFLGLMAAAAVPAAAVVVEAKAFDWNSFFEEATPTELARFHANALTEAMAKMHPEMSWRHAIDHKLQFVLVVGDERRASVVRQEA